MKDCWYVNFNEIGDVSIGYLVALESNKNVPFDIKRVYYTYQVPEAVTRGFHAHKKLEQILICLHGSLVVKCQTQFGEEELFQLNNPNQGLYIGNRVWREMSGYTQDTVLVVLASELYDEKDYIRDYNAFMSYK